MASGALPAPCSRDYWLRCFDGVPWLPGLNAAMNFSRFLVYILGHVIVCHDEKFWLQWVYLDDHQPLHWNSVNKGKDS